MTTAAPHRWSRWVENRGVRLHFLDSGPDAMRSGDPVVFVPGFGEEALDHIAFIETFEGRRAVVADLRGRGPSGAPVADAWTLEDHTGDLHAIISATGAETVHLVSYSRGTGYMMCWAAAHPDRVASLTIGEYHAAHIRPPASALDTLAGRERFGRPLTDRISAEHMAAVFAAAQPVDYYDTLGSLPAPAMLVHGSRSSSMVPPAILDRFLAARPDLEVERFDDTGHDLWRPDPLRFACAVRTFVDAAERATS